MIGAICGDICGSTYERNNTKDYNFELFPAGSKPTDDSVMTIAIADAILTGVSYQDKMREWGRRYIRGGFGKMFKAWVLSDDPKPYGSFGNGSGMRATSIGWAYDTLEEVLEQAKLTAMPTHNSTDGIFGAQSVAAAVFLARIGERKELIKQVVEETFGYNLNRTTAEIRPTYSFDVSAAGSTPEAIICFLESRDFEDCLRLAISLGGDSDTIATMACGIAHAHYKEIPANIMDRTLELLPDDMKKVLEDFNNKYGITIQMSNKETV